MFKSKRLRHLKLTCKISLVLTLSLLFVFASFAILPVPAKAATFTDNYLFSDDFSSYTLDSFPSSCWTDAIGNGGWAIKDDSGNKIFKQSNASGGQHIVYVDYDSSLNWTNYSISAKIKPLGENVGVVGRLQDYNNFYAARFWGGNKLNLVKCVNGTHTTIAEVTFSYSSSEWYYLKLEMHGSTLRVLVDGEEYICATDTTFSSGRPGLRSSPDQRMEADDFYVSLSELDFTVGRLVNDTNPTSGAIGYWGFIGNHASDYSNVSLGFDMGTKTNIDRLELRDSDTSTRADGDDFELYKSDDNATYTAISFTFSSRVESGKTIHTFKLSNVEARYIKIHSKFSDGSYTFRMMPYHLNVKAYGSPCYRLSGAVGYMDQDDTPTSTSMSYWGFDETELAVDRYDSSIGIDLGGEVYSSRLEIRDDNSSTRAGSGNYTLYYSDDNSSYTQMSNVTFTTLTVEGQIIHRFDYPLIDARYIKLHTSYSDGNDTFTLSNPQDDYRVYGPSNEQNFKLSSTYGYLNNDTTPTSGSLSNWTTTGSMAVDYQNRSVGVDLGSTQRVNVIKLVDKDSSTRNKEPNYELYYSTDNSSYTEITGAIFKSEIVDKRIVHTFEFTGIEARYIKVHTTYSDSSHTFALNKPQVDIKAYAKAPPRFFSMPATVGYKTNDSTPTSGVIGDWGSTSSYNFDTTSNSVGLDLGEQLYVNKVELVDNDTTCRGTVSNYAVYYSNDNTTYTAASGLTMIDGREGKGFFLTFNEVSARYIKIHTTYSDSPQLILSNPQKKVRAYSDHEEVSRTFKCTSGYSEGNGYGTCGDIIVMKNGHLLCAYSITNSPEVDWPEMSIAARTSSDGGATWSDQFMLLSCDEEEQSDASTQYVANPNFLRMADGDLGMVYIRNRGGSDDERIYIRRLADEANVESEADNDWSEDWESPVLVSGAGSAPDNGFYFMCNGRATMLANGRIIVPTHWINDNANSGNHPDWNDGYMFYSDNDGVTWYNSDGYNNTGYIDNPDPADPYGCGFLEPGIVQTADGDITAYCRTRYAGAQYRSVSTNNGIDWSEPYRLQGVQTVSSPSTIKLLPNSKTQVMIWNNAFSHNNYPRVPLTAAISRDDGVTWSQYKNIETDSQTASMYIYTSISFSGRKVMLTIYKWKSLGDGEFYMPLTYRVFDRQWLEN